MFVKGRPKTGGRISQEEKIRRLEEKMKGMPKSAKLIDQLSVHGFDFYKALAQTLKAVTSAPKDAESYRLAIATYDRLTELLPFMSPKLREKEVDTAEPSDTKETETVISDEDLLKAFNGDAKTQPRPTDTPVLESGDSKLQLPASTEDDLRDVAGVEENI